MFQSKISPLDPPSCGLLQPVEYLLLDMMSQLCRHNIYEPNDNLMKGANPRRSGRVYTRAFTHACVSSWAYIVIACVSMRGVAGTDTQLSKVLENSEHTG